MEREGAEDTLGKWPPAQLVWSTSDHRLPHEEGLGEAKVPHLLAVECRWRGDSADMSAILVLSLSLSDAG